MSRIIRATTQSGVDTFTSSLLALPILDGKSAYKFTGMEVYWGNGETVAAADYEIEVQVQTISTAATLVSEDFLLGVGWGMQNTGGVAVAVGYEPFKSVTAFDDERLTVSPEIYLGVSSVGTGIANSVTARIYYDIVKISELDYLRLLAAGA